MRRNIRNGIPVAAIAGLMLTLHPAAAAAQAGDPALRRMEVGGQVAFIAGDAASFGPRFTLNFNDRHGLQVGSDFRVNFEDHSQYVGSIYTVEYRYTLPLGLRSTRAFITAGGAGYLDWSHYDAYTYAYPGYSYTNSKGELVTAPASEYHMPAYTSWGGIPPVYPIVGGGAEVKMTSRLALRGDAQLIIYEDGVTWRMSTGVTVALGAPIANRSR